MTGLAGVGTRLYDSPSRAELYGYATNDAAYCRPSSSAAFRAQLTGERDRPLCSNETSDLRQNWTLCDHRTSPLRIMFELLSLEPRGYLHMYANGKSNTHRRRRPQLWGACLGLGHHIMTPGVLRKIFDGGVWLRFSIGYPWLRKFWSKTYPWLRSISWSWAHFYMILRNLSPKIPFLREIFRKQTLL